MAIDPNEYKSSVGLKDLYYAVVTLDSVATFTPGTPKVLAPAMSASLAPTTNSKTQYADDGAFDVMTAEGETKIELEVTELPSVTLAEITGAVFDVASGRVFDNGGVPPYVSLGFRSKKSNGSYRYFWFLKGRFQKPGSEKATDSDTPDPKGLKLTFTAIKTTHPFDLGSVTDSVKSVFGDEDTTDFDATGWFTTVQVPVVAP